MFNSLNVPSINSLKTLHRHRPDPAMPSVKPKNKLHQTDNIPGSNWLTLDPLALPLSQIYPFKISKQTCYQSLLPCQLNGSDALSENLYRPQDEQKIEKQNIIQIDKKNGSIDGYNPESSYSFKPVMILLMP